MIVETMAPRPHVYALDNGLTVALERLPHVYSASAGVWIKTGSANESPREAGLAHFLEHLFFKGTRTRTAHDLMELIESRGGHFNAFTAREYTCLYVRMLREHLFTGLDVLADVLRDSTFNDLEKERNVIVEEIAASEDIPEEHAGDLITAFHWPEHALGQPIAGTQQSVAQLDLQAVRHYFEQWYRPGNMVLAIAGNFDEDAVMAEVERLFGPLPAGETPPPYAPPAWQSGVLPVTSDIGQTHLYFAFPGATVHSDERFAFEVLNNVLGGGSTSRLFERIREDEGLAYSIYSHSGIYIPAGYLGIYAAVAPQNVAQTLDSTYDELRRLRDEPLPEAELASNREQIKGHILMALESTYTRMARLGKSHMYYGRLLTTQEVIDAIDAVTAGEVQALAQRTFTREDCALLTYGPGNGAAVHEVAL